jgi:hypothetical protein
VPNKGNSPDELRASVRAAANRERDPDVRAWLLRLVAGDGRATVGKAKRKKATGVRSR